MILLDRVVVTIVILYMYVIACFLCAIAVQLVQILLKKFCVTDNPKKFSLYEEYSGDCKYPSSRLVYNNC